MLLDLFQLNLEVAAITGTLSGSVTVSASFTGEHPVAVAAGPIGPVRLERSRRAVPVAPGVLDARRSERLAARLAASLQEMQEAPPTTAAPIPAPVSGTLAAVVEVGATVRGSH